MGENTPGDICKHYDDEINLFYAGDASNAYRFLGCHFFHEAEAFLFCVWAPNARSVHIVGDFNDWNPEAIPMEQYRGIWTALVPGLKEGNHYKYYIHGADGKHYYKADPFASYCEMPPGTASVIRSVGEYKWNDRNYIKSRSDGDPQKSPVSIYELHIGSWRLHAGDPYPNFRDVADPLAVYVKEMGFTHVELMPINEYPYDGSWGYQVTGFFAVSARFGTPQDFMYFVDRLHESGIGVIVDWVPAHFPKDAHGLYRFDGSWLYEHADKSRREHPQWGTHIFNYERPEVVSFLISSAVMLFDVYHIDGIRVDAVSSMLYLDYGRDDVYIRNKDGGNIDYAAATFLRKLNSKILEIYPGCITVAEESTAFPLVTKPPYDGGLGFIFKWNMGYMHDTIDYMSLDPYFRGGNHDKMTFSMYYAFSENFILAYSHDEVVHGKASMIEKMYGTYEEKFAALKTLYAYMYAHPGKKLMFMGDEFAQFIEWDYKKQLDWFLLDYESHRGIKNFVSALNTEYKKRPAFFGTDDSWDGFKWLNVEDRRNSVFAFLRTSGDSSIVCIFNFTPVLREGYYVALPEAGCLSLILNSDAETYGIPIRKEANPVGMVKKTAKSKQVFVNGFSHGVKLTLPPLSAQYYTFRKL
ncbi:MAG: 1,4-alpha-glucan branching protein GlgB [Clostridiales Family XIII bacterium]|jgi:1,4-alpha-glucan branching enzyme|nr:1,4-alpha-glucan branching protein GlgB [Clostridiales Family XIII bacterium]